MELPKRPGNDVYLPPDAFPNAIEALKQLPDVRELRIGIVYAFDFRTRMLPYWYADKRMAPCSVRLLADCLNEAGFKHVRVVLQQWTPNFKPSKAELDGKPLDILMVSAMQIHAEAAYDLIRETHSAGEKRPLIIAGGPKAIYEPSDYFEIGPQAGIGADCVVHGEAFVMLDLMKRLIEARQDREHVRKTYNRMRSTGELNRMPGLAYLAGDANRDEPVAINTGIQQLLQNLDQYPMPDAGYRLLEPPHRSETLQPKPLDAKHIKRKSMIASMIATHGCKFNCSYCPIPAVNQRTWRYKSPKRMAEEIRHLHEEFGLTLFFGTDDNFFNSRETVVELMTAISETRLTNGKKLGDEIRFFTEATEFDVHKNLDILPLCRKGGMRGIWFGLEDLTAKLVNKGQNVGKTELIFDELIKLGIQPMAMMIHSDGQPLRSSDGGMSGVLDQAEYLFKAGAVSYQCTYLGPAVGTRSFEESLEGGTMFRRVGGVDVPQAFLDGNHVVASAEKEPWTRQMNIVRAYWSFYNPINLMKTIWGLRKKGSIAPKRVLYQLVGIIGLFYTLPRHWAWARKLKKGPIEKLTGALPSRIPMIDAASGDILTWAIDHPSHPEFERPETLIGVGCGIEETRNESDVALPVVG